MKIQALKKPIVFFKNNQTIFAEINKYSLKWGEFISTFTKLISRIYDLEVFQIFTKV